MDTVTHALVGAAISDCWFRRRLGPLATPFALLVGALPDADAVTYLVSPEYAWAHHRGYSHAILTFVLAAPVFGYVGYRLSKKYADWGLWTLLAFLCLFFHTMVDLSTSWGTMPLLPFSNARISWDMAPILDVFVFSLTAASFAANRLLRWERVDTFLNPLAFPVVHEHPRRRVAADWVAKVCAALVAGYFLIGLLQNFQTVRIARRELAAAGIDAVEVRALPLMFTYIAWGIVARDAEGSVYNAVFSSYAPKPMRFTKFASDRGRAVDAAKATQRGALFAWYAQNMFQAREEKLDGGGTQVGLYDRRFFSLAKLYESRFMMAFPEGVDGQLAPGRAVQMRIRDANLREELRLLWNLTRYGDVQAQE